MQVKSERGRVFGSSNWAREHKDRGRKDEGCFGLANTKVCQGCSEVLGIDKLLLSIYSGLCIYYKTITQSGKEGSEVGLDGEARRGI